MSVHCYLNSTLSLGDNLAGSWDISRNLPISWRRNWDKLIFSVHFQNLDRESESSNISRDRLKHTDYLGPSQQGENCFLNQPGFNKPWFSSRIYSSYNLFTVKATEQGRGSWSARLQLSHVSSGGGSLLRAAPKTDHSGFNQLKPIKN